MWLGSREAYFSGLPWVSTVEVPNESHKGLLIFLGTVEGLHLAGERGQRCEGRIPHQRTRNWGYRHGQLA